jgi:hypothetical protein
METSLPPLILPIRLEGSSERLTSLGGLLVMEELARAVGLWEEVERHFERALFNLPFVLSFPVSILCVSAPLR